MTCNDYVKEEEKKERQREKRKEKKNTIEEARTKS